MKGIQQWHSIKTAAVKANPVKDNKTQARASKDASDLAKAVVLRDMKTGAEVKAVVATKATIGREARAAIPAASSQAIRTTVQGSRAGMSGAMVVRVADKIRAGSGSPAKAALIEIATKAVATRAVATKAEASKAATKVVVTKVAATRAAVTKVAATKVAATRAAVTRAAVTKVAATKVAVTKVAVTKVAAKAVATKVPMAV